MRLQFIVALVLVCGFSVYTSNAQQTAKVTPSNIAYLEYLPKDYGSNNQNYPVVIFLHGIGERGSNSNDHEVLKTSVQDVAKVGLAQYIKYGTHYPFIVISPQLKSSYGTWPANYVMDVLNHVKKYLRIDQQRIYITGLSLGGFGTWTTLAAYPDEFAAAVPICSGGNAINQACTIASKNIPLWAFHDTEDWVVSYGITTSMINAVNACTPKPSPLAKTTLYTGLGHGIWDKVYLETNALDWMLSFKKGGGSAPAPTPPSNAAPVANAGADKTTSGTSISLTGSATDSDGWISSYKWTQFGGATVSLSNANTQTVSISGLKNGTYYFRLTVTDNAGATASDDVVVTVTGQSTANVAPIANAGPDRSTNQSTITLNGSGTDKDGKIVSYRWTQYGGAATTLTNATSPNVTISGLKNGVFYYRLTVTDDKGATHSDNMLVSVSNVSSTPPPTAGNIPPRANAGPDMRVPANASSFVVKGSGTDADGRIVSYKWTQYSGPRATLSNANTPNVTVTGLQQGLYYLRLTVEDDKGATHHDNVLVVVGAG